jgi:hypothetical protein
LRRAPWLLATPLIGCNRGVSKGAVSNGRENQAGGEVVDFMKGDVGKIRLDGKSGSTSHDRRCNRCQKQRQIVPETRVGAVVCGEGGHSFDGKVIGRRLALPKAAIVFTLELPSVTHNILHHISLRENQLVDVEL